jgi:hypothetical protein
MLKMNITSVIAMTTNNEQPTSNSSKQSQTKPILPAYMAGKIALSVAEGPIKTTARPPAGKANFGTCKKSLA